MKETIPFNKVPRGAALNKQWRCQRINKVPRPAALNKQWRCQRINKVPRPAALNKPFTEKEFKKIIQNLKTNTSEGYDCISSEMIKDSPTKYYPQIHEPRIELLYQNHGV